MTRWFVGLCLLISSTALANPGFEKRWIYSSFNLSTPESLTQLEKIMRRGAKVGYNGLLLADGKKLGFKHGRQAKLK